MSSRRSPPNVHETFRKHLLNWAQDNLRPFPWREDPTPYEILVAEIFLTQTPATRVEPIYSDFLDAYPSLDRLAEADLDGLADRLRPLGFQNRRAEALKQIGKELQSKGLPNTLDELTDLPYVGRYAANATLCFGFGKRRPIVDANVIRIYNRVFDTDFRDVEDDDAWNFAEIMLPEREYQTYNLALIDFGALVCTARHPSFDSCPMTEFCIHYIRNQS